MMLRRTCASILLAALALAPCLGVCAGWAYSGDTRMACCVGKPANEATMCCASGESRDNSDAASVLVALPPSQPIALKVASALTPRQRAESAIDSHNPEIDDSARHVLLSVFLI